MVEKNKGFQIFAHVLMVFLSLCCLAPFFLLIMSSVTAEDALIANGYSFSRQSSVWKLTAIF